MKISERHAILEWNGKEWTLEDLGSSNGTCVDGIPISEGTLDALVEAWPTLVSI